MTEQQLAYFEDARLWDDKEDLSAYIKILVAEVRRLNKIDRTITVPSPGALSRD